MLKGKKIYLRAVEPTDAELILNWENDPANWRVSGTQLPFSKHLIEQYVQSAQDIYSVKQTRLMICESDSDTCVGTLDFFDFEPKHQRAGVGILIDKNYRENGYAKEALEVAENYALNGIGIRNLYCNILADNSSSIALFEGRGFESVGLKKNWFNDGNGKWIDEMLYQKQLVKE